MWDLTRRILACFAAPPPMFGPPPRCWWCTDAQAALDMGQRCLCERTCLSANCLAAHWI
jgi:hypothetical protein